ncbi:MAG: hypothetical protein M1822_005996 [Bathelium mastoideum]|nr:MAG: hypothetical protein M1822_005996 [Bathelium mastoideum]
MVTRESAVNYGPSNTAEDENAIPSMTNHSDLAKFRERGTGTYVEILQKIVETMTDRSRNKLGKTMSTVQGTVVQNNDTRILGARPPLEDPFGDRSEALGAIQGGFSDSLKSSVFVLHGIGGVGKTQIALKYIAERAGSFNKILWVQADCEERLEESLRTIANEMLLTSENNRDDLELIISKLVNSTNRFLIVFDNIDERALLKTIVEILQPRQAKNLCVLITTRDKESMSLATKSYEVRPFEKNQGSRLLLELVGNAQVCSTTTASQICNELGNLPLAIKQMAAYITIAGMPSGSIAEQVRSEPRLAMVFTPELWPYRKSVMTVWEPSLGRIRTLNPYAERWLLLCSFLGREVPHEIYIHAFNQFSIRPYAHLAWLFESTGHWSPNIMLHNIQELHKASLITTVEHMKRRFSFMHPLVQHWAPTRLPTQEKIKYIEQSSWMLHACAEDLCRGDDPESIRAYLKQRWLFPFVSACVDFTRHDLRRNLGELITTESAVTFAILYIQEQKPEIAQDIMMEAAIKRADGNGETTLRPRRILCWALRRQKSCDVAAAVQESVVAQMELADMPPQHLLEARKELVAIYRDGRQWNKAMTLSIKVEEDAYNIFGREALETLRVMSCIATVRCQIDLEEGLLIEKYVVETYRKKYPGKEEFANKLRNLAITYYELGRFEDAEKLEIEVLELKACLFGPDHYETASAKHNLAATLTKLQKYPRVEELFQSALDIRYRALGERNQRTIKTAAKLAKTLLAMGEGAKAQKIREQYHIATSA